MKKLLALVLALVMVMGLATVSTSAAYTDANDIDYTEAVDVMTAVGVFQGKGDAFAPKDGLNRAEAAKLIAYLMLGNKTAEAMTGSGTRFTDVPASHWAAGFIEYLASVGVVSGVGNGQFNPNGQVTAVQFAKMLLVALGYDAELENFVGEGWSINIQKKANECDLFDVLDVSANDALTREQAAQMCLNDLKADMVKYEDKGTTVKIGESTVVTGAKEPVKKTSTATKADAIGKNDAGVLQLGEDLYSGDLTLKKGETDDMGRPANKWKYKTEDVGTYAAYDDMIFEAQDEVKVTTVYNTLGKTVYDDFKDTGVNHTNGTGSVQWKVYVDGEEMTKYFPYTDLMNKDSNFAIGADADGTTPKTVVSNYGTRFTGNGSTTQIFLQEDEGKGGAGGTTAVDLYTFVITNEYLVQATADYSSTREEVNVKWITTDYPWDVNTTTNVVSQNAGNNVIKQEDFNVSGVKKDDYLVVTYSYDNGFQTVKPATMLEGEITKYVANDTVTIDGTLYKYAKKVNSDDKATTYSVGNKAIMVTDGKYILAVDDANATKDYVYLQDIGSNNGLKNYVKAALYGTDAALRTVDVKKITDAAGTEYTGTKLTNLVGNGEEALYGWYTYSVDDSGVYTLKEIYSTGIKNTSYNNETLAYNLAAGAFSNFEAINGDKVKFLTSSNGSIVNVSGNNKTVFIVLDNDDDTKIYNGLSEAPTIQLNTDTKSGAAYISYIIDGTYATYVFIDLSETTDSAAVVDDSTLSNDYIMVVKSNSSKINYDKKDNSNNYYTDEVLFEGEIVKKDFAESAAGTFTLGTVYNKIHTNSKGFITSASALTDGKDYAVGSGNSKIQPITSEKDTVYIGGEGLVLNSDNCVYLVLGSKTDPAKDKNADYTPYLKIDGAALESYLQGKDYTYNYAGIRHDDNSSTVDALYVWIGAAQAVVPTISSDHTDGKNYTYSGDFTVADNVKITNGTSLTVNGTLILAGGDDMTIDGATVTAKNVAGNSTVTANGGTIYIKGNGKLIVSGKVLATTVQLDGCELTVGGAATIGTLKVTGTSSDPAKVTFNGNADLATVQLNANSTTTFNGTTTKVTNLTANEAAIVANKSVEVRGASTVTGGSVTFANNAEFKGAGKVTYAGDVDVEKANAATMTVNIAAIKDFDVEKFSATGLTYTYKVGNDTIVLTFLAKAGSVTYNGYEFGAIGDIKDKKATVTATQGSTKELALEAEKLNGVTVTVSTGKN